MNTQFSKKWLIGLFLTLMLLGGTVGLASARQAGENPPTEADAINAAAESAQFAAGLAKHPGWIGAAYDTGNAYGIWRVQFTSPEGDDLGWADVNPVKGKVYAWEIYTGMSEIEKAAAQPIIKAFLANSPEILELIDNPAQYELYVDYDSSSGYWGAYIARGGTDSLYVLVDFADDEALTEPRLVRFYFDVPSYKEWFNTAKAEATAIAFLQPEVAEAVRGVEGWVSSAERSGNRWTIVFSAGEEVLAQATVDLDTDQVTDYSTGE